MPAYDGLSIINVIATLLRHFGVSTETPPLVDSRLADALAGKQKVVLFLLDGLGWRNLKHAERRCPGIRRSLTGATQIPITSVFPSTTSAAMSSVITGLPPAQHGVLGFLMYFPEYGRVFNMLNFHTPDEGKKDLLDFGFNPEAFYGQPTMLERLRDAGVFVGAYTFHAYAQSGLSRLLYHAPPYQYLALGDLISQAVYNLQVPGPQVLFIYWSTLDTLAHTYGAESPAYAIELFSLANTVSTLLRPELDDETAVILTADHGHIDGHDDDAIDLMSQHDLRALFRLPPAGEGRAMHLFIRPGEVSTARARLERIGHMTVLSREEVLALGLYGCPLRAGWQARIGDLVLLPHGSRRVMYAYQPRPHTAMAGRHGGLTVEEMIVPLLVWG